MPEADAEGDTPWLWPTTSDDRRHEAPLAFAFWSHCLALKGKARPSPVFRPFHFKRIPREKRKSMGSGNGARAERRSEAEALAMFRDTTRAERTIWYRVGTRSARAKSGVVAKIGSSVFQYRHQSILPALVAESLFHPHHPLPMRTAAISAMTSPILRNPRFIQFIAASKCSPAMGTPTCQSLHRKEMRD